MTLEGLARCLPSSDFGQPLTVPELHHPNCRLFVTNGGEEFLAADISFLVAAHGGLNLPSTRGTLVRYPPDVCSARGQASQIVGLS
jgi:hypothetical protein